MELNPLTTEIHDMALAIVHDIEPTIERMGGPEVVDQLVVGVRNAALMVRPELAVIVAGPLEAAIFAGMSVGMAAERRACKGDEFMQGWGE